ncbi:microfibrillar-associated protein 5 isoform X2 [Hyla sarda]|nr:microfibrillar-associated protein 5 isoform X2 [Hyla sarda]XP_056388345.1 microfibrillar-associated protein 5 isoform X2 [Hyla sarda]
MSGLHTGYCCLLLLTVLSLVLPALGNVVRRNSEDTVTPAEDTDDSGNKVTPSPGGCKEVQYPCTRVYSVQKPVKQCISYLCVTSVRRVYMVNKEICTKIMCKEDEIIQDEKCRQLAGLPPRRQPELQEPAEGAPDEN